MTKLEQLLADLVRIDSINPTLVPGAPGECEIAQYVADWARSANLAVERISRRKIQSLGISSMSVQAEG